MNSRYLFIDLNTSQTQPLSRFNSIFTIRNGIYSPLERIRKKEPEAEIFLLHPNKSYEVQLAKLHKCHHYSAENIEELQLDKWLGDINRIRIDTEKLEEQYTQVFFSTEFSLYHLLDNLEEQITFDLEDWLNNKKLNDSVNSPHIKISGKEKSLYIHQEANILPGSIFDTRKGPIIIDSHVSIKPFSYLCGPLYVAPYAHIDNAQIKGPTVIGKATRVSGEIESSIIGDFSNKHHEGFLGHSLVGNWVNLGALTTTSNLKNNYSTVHLELPKKVNNYTEMTTLNTQQIKFGALIGDCVKTAIGTLLNTGTVIDAGCNIFGGNVSGYLPPFTWGNTTGTLYELERFLSDAQKIAKRREQTLPESFIYLASELHTNISTHK